MVPQSNPITGHLLEQTISDTQWLKHQVRNQEIMSSILALGAKPAGWVVLDQSLSLRPQEEAKANHF